MVLKMFLRTSMFVLICLSAICFTYKYAFEDQLVASNPKDADSRFSEKVSLHQGFVPATPDQNAKHLWLEMGAYGAVLVAGLIFVSQKWK